MQPLILAVDSGLDGAFVWMRGGKVLHHVLTRTMVKDGVVDMRALEMHSHETYCMFVEAVPRIAYMEEPFNNAISGGASTSGYTDQCKRWGRLQGWLESWGYEVRGVQAKTWQREILDLARFPDAYGAHRLTLAVGWKLNSYTDGWRLTGPDKTKTVVTAHHAFRKEALQAALAAKPESIVAMARSHDTKAAAIAYAREHFPGVELVPPRCKNPHDGLADAICIAAWATKKEAP